MQFIPLGMQPIVTGLMTDECKHRHNYSWYKKIKVLAEKSLPTPLCQPQILLRLFDKELRGQKSATNNLS